MSKTKAPLLQVCLSLFVHVLPRVTTRARRRLLGFACFASSAERKTILNRRTTFICLLVLLSQCAFCLFCFCLLLLINTFFLLFFSLIHKCLLLYLFCIFCFIFRFFLLFFTHNMLVLFSLLQKDSSIENLHVIASPLLPFTCVFVVVAVLFSL